MRTIELVFELPAVEIFANVRQSLLQLEQRICNVSLICERNIAPHGIWARCNPSHFAQRTATGVEHRSIFAVFINQTCGERGGDELGNVADPRTKLIVFTGIKLGNLGADFFEP